jgi:hypothetical protein
MQEAGIECMLLKGADVVTRLYGVMGLRAMVDVDLLVREKDLPVLDRFLRQSGYRPQIDGNAAYVHPDGALTLDIITSIWYLENPEEVWQRAVQRSLDGILVKAMDTTDLLIYLTAYAVVHRGNFTGPFSEDILLLLTNEPVDWERLLADAAHWNLKIPLYHGLRYARMHSAAIPDHVLTTLAPAGHTERLLYVMLKALVHTCPIGEVGHLLLFLTQQGWKRWRWLWRALFPSGAFLTYRYGQRTWRERLGVRLRRPFELTCRLVVLAVRILRHLRGPHASLPAPSNRP